jgi:hypothetical protein
MRFLSSAGSFWKGNGGPTTAYEGDISNKKIVLDDGEGCGWASISYLLAFSCHLAQILPQIAVGEVQRCEAMMLLQWRERTFI